ncbi:hypothetical protein DE146DRAFT_199265 [Phaeosphaeria sp. MPI-PUGE-AT-0046c]|nr:hypothetical protein DE146DRAFT_199265 [Phaeosphaeria sp. MPI-PUGE-AT-0046c]
MSTFTPNTNVGARRSTSCVFGDAAPNMDIGFPEGLRITAVEFLVYFPNAIRNYEPLLRFVQADLDQVTLARILNFHRRWDRRPILTNTCGVILRKATREGTGDNLWNTSLHKRQYAYDRTWADEEFTLQDIELNCPRTAPPDMKPDVRTHTITFADLARDVHVHPSFNRGDGFMLTRCVQYAAANPGMGYVFPDDFDTLVRKLDDNRRLSAEHYEKASIRRWADSAIKQAYGNAETESFEQVAQSDNETNEDLDSDQANLFSSHGDDLLGIMAELMRDEAPNSRNMGITGPLMADHSVFPPLPRPMNEGFSPLPLSQPSINSHSHSAVVIAASYELQSHLWTDWDLLDALAPDIVDVYHTSGNLETPLSDTAFRTDQHVSQPLDEYPNYFVGGDFLSSDGDWIGARHGRQ